MSQRLTELAALGVGITDASVKVMRSHDYCHFEVVLGIGVLLGKVLEANDVDDIRKEAARLADKAVEQYKTAKRAQELRATAEQMWRLEEAKKTPEEERSPNDKAIIKYHSDAAFRRRFDYDYEDGWEQPDYGDEEA